MRTPTGADGEGNKTNETNETNETDEEEGEEFAVPGVWPSLGGETAQVIYAGQNDSTIPYITHIDG
jgi:hypothetical protein